jgi:uncharacterized protein YggU (UPF0235/DUF167 family)
MSFLEISEDPARGTLTLNVRVQPRASKDEIAGALEALVAFLSGLLKTPKSAVRIQSGEHGRNKRVEIRGVTRQQIIDLLREEA